LVWFGLVWFGLVWFAMDIPFAYLRKNYLAETYDGSSEADPSKINLYFEIMSNIPNNQYILQVLS